MKKKKKNYYSMGEIRVNSYGNDYRKNYIYANENGLTEEGIISGSSHGARINTDERMCLEAFYHDKSILMCYCLDNNIPLRVISEYYVSYEEAKTIVRVLYDYKHDYPIKDKYDKKNHNRTKIYDIDVWKICNSTMIKSPKFRWCLEALAYGVRVVDELDNADSYDEEVIYLIAKAAFYNTNICKDIYPGIDIEELRKRCSNLAKAKKKLHNITFEEAIRLYQDVPY